jgi:hypothetical protein
LNFHGKVYGGNHFPRFSQWETTIFPIYSARNGSRKLAEKVFQRVKMFFGNTEFSTIQPNKLLPKLN